MKKRDGGGDISERPIIMITEKKMKTWGIARHLSAFYTGGIISIPIKKVRILKKRNFDGTFLTVPASKQVRVEKMKQEVNMSFKTKVAIFLLATLITLAGFNLIASSSALDIMKVGKQAGYEIIANVLAKADAASNRSSSIR